MRHQLFWTGLLLLMMTVAHGQTVVPVPSSSLKPSVDGRLSSRAFYSWDNGDASQEVLIAFFETDVRAKNLTSWSTGLVLDATFIGDLTESNERRFGETETIQRVRQLYVIHPGIAGVLDISVGRRLIAEAGNGWVDGIDARYALSSGMHLGVYGGLRPDQTDFAVTPDYQAAGIYYTLRLERFDADIAYNAVLRDGLDRQFIFFRTHMKLAERLFATTYAVADLQEDSDLTTVIATVDYSPIRPLNLTLTYSRYSLEQYRDTVIYRNVVEPNQALVLGDEIIDLVYNRLRTTASYRFWRRFYHYQSVEYKRRSQDNRDAWLYTIGVRDDDFMKWGTRLDLRTTFRNNFRSDSWLLALEVEQDVSRSLTVNIRATHFDGQTIDRLSERGRTFDEAQRIYLIGTGLYWRVTRSHLLTLDYDGIYETDLVDQRNDIALFIHTMMVRYAYYF